MKTLLIFIVILFIGNNTYGQKWCGDGVHVLKKSDLEYTIKWSDEYENVITNSVTVTKSEKGGDSVTKTCQIKGSSNYYRVIFFKMIMTNEPVAEVKYYNELGKLIWKKTCSAWICDK